jgi:hypothetical protein
MVVTGGVPKFEKFFREAADLDIDKSDIKRYEDFVHRKIYDLLLRAQATAKANAREFIEPHDLPITKGLQESIHQFRKLDHVIELQPILDDIATRPQLDLGVLAETEEVLPEIAGGLSVALARSFRIVDPKLANPQSVHWERAFRLFDLLL